MEKLDSITFDQLLGNQNPLQASEARFDLNGARLITASAMVTLAAACHYIHRDGRRPVIALNEQSVRRYLARSGFVSIMLPITTFEPPFPPHVPAVFERMRGS